MAPVTGAPVWAGVPPPGPRWEYGLQSQASVVTSASRASYAGVEYETEGCVPSRCWDHTCTPGLPPGGGIQLDVTADPSDPSGYTARAEWEVFDDPNGSKFDDPADQDFVTSQPFTVYNVSPPCAGGYAMDRAQARARERLEATEWQAVERVFQSGFCGAEPNLSLGEPELPAGTDPVHPAVALSYIEFALRDSGSPGVIHAPREAYPFFRSYIVRSGPQLETQVGAGWAFGRGYTNVPPGEQAPAERVPVADGMTAWIYVTGNVRIWRSPIVTPGDRWTTFDREHNATRAIAERTYTVTYSCPLAAVNVDLSQTI